MSSPRLGFASDLSGLPGLGTSNPSSLSTKSAESQLDLKSDDPPVPPRSSIYHHLFGHPLDTPGRDSLTRHIQQEMLRDPSMTQEIRSMLQSPEFKADLTLFLNSPTFVNQLLNSDNLRFLIAQDPDFRLHLQTIIHSAHFRQLIESAPNLPWVKGMLSSHACYNIVTSSPTFQGYLESIMAGEVFKKFVKQAVQHPDFIGSLSSRSDFKQKILESILQDPRLTDQIVEGIVEDPFFQREVQKSEFLDRILQRASFKDAVAEAMVQSPSFQTLAASIATNPRTQARVQNASVTDSILTRPTFIREAAAALGPGSDQTEESSRLRTLEAQLQVALTQIGQLRSEIRDLQARSIPRDDSRQPAMGPRPPSPRSADRQLDLEDHLLQGERYFNQYLQQHPQLPPGSWISLVDNDYRTTRAFSTYRDAAKAHRGHNLWFCRRYKGPLIQRDSIKRISFCGYGLGGQTGQDPSYAYSQVRVINPYILIDDQEPSHQTQMMLDTGATTSMGTREILRAELQLQANDYGEINGIDGGPGIPVGYVDADLQVGDLGPVEAVQIAYKIQLVGTPDDWILGQNFLRECKHTWTPDRVELQYPHVTRRHSL